MMIKVIKDNWKGILIALLTIALIVSVRSCSSNKSLYNSEKDLSKVYQDSFANNIKMWKDQYNREHTTIEQHRLDLKVFEQYVDSTAKVLKVKDKQIEGLTQIKTSIAASGKGKEIKKDTTYAQEADDSLDVADIYEPGEIEQINFSWPQTKDSIWLQVKGTLGKKDSISVTGRDSLVVADYWKRKWFLGPKHYFTDVSNSNPFITIPGVRSVKPVYKEPKWLIAPSAQAAYWNKKLQVIPGVSLIYYPLSIKIK